MKKKILLISVLLLAVLTLTSCTKRCRCMKNDTTLEYFTPEEVSAQGKTCAEMRYMDGLTTLRYSYCEWVYNE